MPERLRSGILRLPRLVYFFLTFVPFFSKLEKDKLEKSVLILKLVDGVRKWN